MISTIVPVWLVGILVAVFWFIQNGLRRHVRLWALVTLPATLFHEVAHGAVGVFLQAKPSSFNLWPKRVSASSWRLGYVGFTNLRWWNGGAVALAPLLWALGFAIAFDRLGAFPVTIELSSALWLSVLIVWGLIALAPSSSDWRMALSYWPSSIVFLLLWSGCLYLTLAYK
jgi:hypothetical protein